MKKGLRLVDTNPVAPGNVWTHALMKKGLRLRPLLGFRIRGHVWTHALMKKGLRPSEGLYKVSSLRLDPRPDEEGIKTNLPIKAYFHLAVWTHALMKKGLRREGPQDLAGCNVWTHALMKKGLRPRTERAC